MSSRRRWLLAMLMVAALAAPLPAVRAALPVDAGSPAIDLAKLKLGDFVHELQADPAGLYYEVLLSVDTEAAARAAVPAGRMLRFLPHVGVARTVLDRDEILRAVQNPAIEGLEPDRSLELMNAGARDATGVDAVQDRQDDGRYAGLAGAGIHVAVIDSGLDTTHPDFAGRIEHAWEIVSSDPEGFVPVGTGTVVPGLDGDPVGPPARAYVGSAPASTRIDVEFQDSAVARGRLGAGAGTDTAGHGTHVTGTLAGGGNVEPSARGVAPAARIHSYKFAHSLGLTSVPASFVAEAFEHVLAHNERSEDEHDIRVVNMSLGGGPTCGKDPGLTRPNQRALRRAFEERVLVVVAYGNWGPAPATCTIQSQQPWVLGVANGEKGGRIAGDSSRGAVDVSAKDWVANYDREAAIRNAYAFLAASEDQRKGWSFVTDPTALHRPGITAPGSRIVSTIGRNHASTQPGAYTAGGPYGMMSGTSMAAPHAAGVATLVIEAHRAKHGVFPDPLRVIEILEGTADPEVVVTAPVFAANGTFTAVADFRWARPHEMGAGYVDAKAAIAAARAAAPAAARPSRPAALPTRSWSGLLGNCASPVVVGSFVTDRGQRTCAIEVPPGVQTMRIVATPRTAGDVVAVRLSEQGCPGCGDRSATIINTSKPVVGKVYDVAVRRPRPGSWTVRFDGTSPGPGAPTAVSPVIELDATVTFEYRQRPLGREL